MKKPNKWLILGGILVLCAAAAVLWFLPESRSLGVIGGADGPTAILVTTTR